MRALFKPEDGNVLIIKDADFNESTLLHNFFNNFKGGNYSVEVQERNTGIHDSLTGLVFKLVEQEKPIEVITYIKTNQKVTNIDETLPLFMIEFTPDNSNYLNFKVDISKWALFKLRLEDLGLTDVTITNDGKVIGNNGTGAAINGIVTVPKGLFQFVNRLDSSVSNFSDIVELVLGLDDSNNSEDKDTEDKGDSNEEDNLHQSDIRSCFE